MSVLDHSLNSSSLKPFWAEEIYPLSHFQLPQVLLQDTFLIKSQNSLQAHQVSLTPDSIFFKVSENLIKVVKIKWAIIESFYEEKLENCLYGFSIVKPEGKEDFFMTSETVLEKWLEILAGICLMTGFEQDFFIVKKIDSGKFGDICLCQVLDSCEEYAVKVIRKENLKSLEQVKFLRGEIKALRRLDHPLCVKLNRVYEEDEFIMLVMEYVPHGSLLSRIQKYKKFTESEVALIALRLITAICHLNDNSIIHRDLKPDNILMTSSSNNYDIKITDFGLASCSLKPQTTICGSPGFMAPEMLQGECYNEKFDIFSVGVICYILLTGKYPFSSKSVKEVLEKNRNCELKFDKKIWKDYSSIALNFVQGLMDKDKLRRPSAEMALAHPWLSKYIVKSESENTHFTQQISEL